LAEFLVRRLKRQSTCTPDGTGAAPKVASVGWRDDGCLGAPASRHFFGVATSSLESQHMFGSVGMPELLIIFVIALMIFGPRRLPELGRAVGLTINEFKKGANNLRESVEEEVRRENEREAPAPAQPDEQRRQA
jgi:sec-independent protein translocase protein TatA